MKTIELVYTILGICLLILIIPGTLFVIATIFDNIIDLIKEIRK